jgi:hydroxyquinol 1,2-dioxygenase
VITGPDDVTAAVLVKVERAGNPRTRELLAAGVQHLHAFVRETGLTRPSSTPRADHRPVGSAQHSVPQRGRADRVAHDTATEPAPDPDVSGTWYSVEDLFVIEPGDAALPDPPITGKATGGAPAGEVLERRP